MRYRGSWKCGIDNQKTRSVISQDDGYYRRHLSDIASSDNGDDVGDDDDEEIQQGLLSEDDEPGWVMGKITKTEKQRMDRIRQKQVKLDELTQPG